MLFMDETHQDLCDINLFLSECPMLGQTHVHERINTHKIMNTAVVRLS